MSGKKEKWTKLLREKKWEAPETVPPFINRIKSSRGTLDAFPP